MRALTIGSVVTLIIAGGLPASAQQGGTAINGSQPAPIDDTVVSGRGR